MDVPKGHPLGADPQAFLEGLRPQIYNKLEEEIRALSGIKFQLALKVQLRKTGPDGTEEYTDPVFRHKQEVILQRSEIDGALDKAAPPPYPGAAREVDTERVWMGCRPSGMSVVGHSLVSAPKRRLLHPISKRGAEHKSCHPRQERE